MRTFIFNLVGAGNVQWRDPEAVAVLGAGRAGRLSRARQAGQAGDRGLGEGGAGAGHTTAAGQHMICIKRKDAALGHKKNS